MKDHRFIELLNLYIDRQISAEETAELEAEIQSHPKRQAVYRQYCQIHAATKRVYDSFRAVAAEQPVPTGRQNGVVELFETRRRTRWTTYAGAFAAAACLALVFSLVRQGQPAASSEMAVQPVASEMQLAAAKPGPVILTPAAVNLETASGLPERVAPSADYTAMLAALREQDEERAFHNERLKIGRVQPLFDDDMFEARRIWAAQEQRVYQSQSMTPAQQAEFSAFQFQR